MPVTNPEDDTEADRVAEAYRLTQDDHFARPVPDGDPESDEVIA